MAKNMHNASYRKLDVDAYDPEQFQDQDDNNVDTPGLGIDEKQVNQLLQSGRFDDALRMALRNPPMRTKNQV
jgi:actin related protein 2/3 complex subunit 5